jgi:hypothetical protein
MHIIRLISSTDATTHGIIIRYMHITAPLSSFTICRTSRRTHPAEELTNQNHHHPTHGRTFAQTEPRRAKSQGGTGPASAAAPSRLGIGFFFCFSSIGTNNCEGRASGPRDSSVTGGNGRLSPWRASGGTDHGIERRRGPEGCRSSSRRQRIYPRSCIGPNQRWGRPRIPRCPSSCICPRLGRLGE